MSTNINTIIPDVTPIIAEELLLLLQRGNWYTPYSTVMLHVYVNADIVAVVKTVLTFPVVKLSAELLRHMMDKPRFCR